VGDINQAIYGFANRFPKYLIELIGNSDFSHYELSKNHRCHPSISEYSLCLFGASKTILPDKRVFLVNVQGSEIQIAQKIDEYLDRIKTAYSVTSNNKIAILCRGNGTVQLLDKALQSPHKVFVDTILDKDNSDWCRLFRDTLVSCFDSSVYAMDYASDLFSEETEPEKYRHALQLCHTIFSCTPETISSVEEEFVSLAKLIYPKGDNEAARTLLHSVLTDAGMLQSYVPAADHEINIMTLHKSKGLEFNIVFHMDMYKYIISDDWGDTDDISQMLNLHYVGVTRAIDVCYIMNGSKRYSSKYNDFINAYPSAFLSKPGLSERRRNVVWK
jgi:DNA helicase-2/ATP-dependent DNA helicase PcrA